MILKEKYHLCVSSKPNNHIYNMFVYGVLLSTHTRRYFLFHDTFPNRVAKMRSTRLFQLTAAPSKNRQDKQPVPSRVQGRRLDLFSSLYTARRGFLVISPAAREFHLNFHKQARIAKDKHANRECGG